MDQLSNAFSALSDPTRRAILSRLRRGGANFTELAEPFDMSKPAVVKHIKALEKAGLIHRTGSHTRPVYRLNAAPMQAPRDWLDEYRQFWESSLESLDSYVREVVNNKGGEA